MEKIWSFLAIDWAEASFGYAREAVAAGLILLLIFTISYALYRKKFYRTHSGFSLGQVPKESIPRRLMYFIPRFTLILALVLVILALSDPFVSFAKTGTKTVYEEAFERIDLIDVSTSMNNDKAKLARRAFLRLLELREGEGDRACLWVFSSNPYKIQGCISDDLVYRFKAETAPLILTSAWSYAEGVVTIQGEGDTNIHEALQAIIDYIDNEGDADIKKRVLLIMTDAEFPGYPEEEMIALQRRGVVVFLLLTSRVSAEKSFLDGVYRSGGGVYTLGDELVLAKAIGRLKKGGRVEVRRQETAVLQSEYVFQIPLDLAIILVLFSLYAAAALEITFGGRYP